jgi:hypothetical protein
MCHGISDLLIVSPDACYELGKPRASKIEEKKAQGFR